MLYRIYTENKNYETVIKIINDVFPNFTISKSDGYFDGQHEHALIIDIVADIADRTKVQNIAWSIKKRNKQDSVLLIAVDCDQKYTT